MPFKTGITRADVQTAMTDQGYTGARAVHLDAAISSRAVTGAEMSLDANGRTAVQTALTDHGYTAARGALLANLDAAVTSRAAAGAEMALTAGALVNVRTQVDGGLAAEGVTSARMAKMDVVAAPVTATDSSVGAALTVTLDTAQRSIVEIRYTSSAAAAYVVEGSPDNVSWFEGDAFSEAAPVTNKVIGYLNAMRYVRLVSVTAVDHTFTLTALL